MFTVTPKLKNKNKKARVCDSEIFCWYTVYLESSTIHSGVQSFILGDFLKINCDMNCLLANDKIMAPKIFI